MKKLLLVLFMIFPFMVGGCSCDSFSLSTYESAVKNFNNSTGFEYELTVTIRVEGQDYYMREESRNKYLLDTAGNVYDFSSELKSYKVLTPDNLPEGAPTLVYTYNRYYVGATNKFYENEIEGNVREEKRVYDKSYEEMYSDDNHVYNIKNLVPTFSKDELTGFQISDIEDQKGYSTSMFTAPVPSHIQCSEDVTLYGVTMNKNFYFHTIEFIVVNNDTTTTYEYRFLNYNSNVNIEFPANLANY